MRVALVPYQRDWSYDFTAQALVKHLSDRFDMRVYHNDTLDRLDPRDVDLVVDFWWRGGLARRFGPRALIQVSSHRWGNAKYGSLSVAQLVDGYLRRAGGVLVPSRRLASDLDAAPHVTIAPKGFHPEAFGDAGARRGDLVVGWAGAANALDKRLDVITAAWPGVLIATGLAYDAMPGFYNEVDVITCASTAEGDPRPLIEGMACGCFPVTVDVGIVPELVRHGENGLIVERSPHAFEAALRWCARNLDYVRAAGARNALEMRATRTWGMVAPAWSDAFAAAIDRAPAWKLDKRTERAYRIRARMRKRRELRKAGS